MRPGATSEQTTGRRYGGQDPAARQAARREQLLDAGLECFGTDGYQRTSVKQVCERAGLTQRYFYESFDDRESLLLGVYDSVVDVVRGRTEASIADGGTTIADLARIALGEFVDCLTEDARRARIMLLEVVGVSPALEARRYRVIHDFADVIVAAGAAHAGLEETTHEFHLVAVGLVGAVNQLLVDWVLGNGSTDPDHILAVCVRLFAATFDDFVPD